MTCDCGIYHIGTKKEDQKNIDMNWRIYFSQLTFVAQQSREKHVGNLLVFTREFTRLKILI